MEQVNKIKSNPELLKESEVKATDEIKEDPTCLSILQGIKEIPLLTLGNFSAIIGPAKSRKTFFLSLLLSTLSGIGILQSKFKKNLSGRVILFDTEQSKFHVQKFVKRIIRMSENDKLFSAYSLRPFAPQRRIELIEEQIYNTKNLKVIAIDGVRDLVRNINSEEEATEVVSKLMRWTHDLNIHIITIIHMNKADQSARGHIGTEIQNKSETVISVTKDIGLPDSSDVEHKFARGLDFEKFSFNINGGLPEINEKDEEEKKEEKPF